jgi:two-component system, sensor histidine kinase and response regulator
MKKILVIEDEQFIRENIVEILEASDFDVYSAPNGKEGVTLALERLPDLILCDVMMPELDGHGVLETLRKNPATATTPFIFLTARANSSDLRAGMNLGADDYLTKPFRVPELLSAVTARLAKSANLQEQTSQRMTALRDSISLSLPHEFLTPISGILGCAELITASYDRLSKEDVLDLLVHLTSSARRLSRLIQNFLLHARLITASVEQANGEARQLLGLSTGEVTEAVCAVIKDIVMTKALQQEIPSLPSRAEHMQLTFDADATVIMRQMYFSKIIEEIIDNALKYSLPESEIIVTTSIHAATNHFVVQTESTGRTMTPEQVDSIGAFSQFDRRLYEQQGSGLGLSIVKKLLDFHNGTFDVASDATTSKTTVTISVPIGEPL